MRVTFLLLLIASAAHADLGMEGVVNCGPGVTCRSQLVRLSVAPGVLDGALASSPQLQTIGVPALEGYLSSEAFRQSFVREYELAPGGFPFKSEQCLLEQAQGDPQMQGIDCHNRLLCGDSSVPEGVKRELCFSIPCSLIMGSHQMGQCPAQASARPVQIAYPAPMNLRSLQLRPMSLSYEDSVLRACMSLDQLDVETAFDIGFEARAGVSYPRLGMRNLRIQLDGPREVCMNFTLNMNGTPLITNVRMENPSGTPFISDGMIDRALAGASLTGLTGYSPATLNIIKATALPPMARYLRPALESGILDTLSTTFQQQISQYVEQGLASTNQSVATPQNSLVSELGVANVAVGKYADLLECAWLKSRQQTVPADHACLGQLYSFRNRPLRVQDIPNLNRAMGYLEEQMNRYEQVTSEGLRQQLLALEAPMSAAGQGQLFRTRVAPLAQRIERNQANSQLVQSLQVMGTVGQGLSGEFGVSVPEVCDVLNPSTHAHRSIPNCPVQAYVDLEEMNRLLDSMYRSGRLCHRGRGDYVPELAANGQPRYNSDGSPRGTGCHFLIEEEGMSCYLNGAPRLRFDPATQGYKVQLNTRACFRPAVILGQGKIGGDINFEIGFTPSVCGNGDFCLENGEATWNVVPGTARFALQDSSWLNGLVRGAIDDQLNALVRQTIRIPLASGQGAMSQVPLAAEGRVDQGEGFFGACLELK